MSKKFKASKITMTELNGDITLLQAGDPVLTHNQFIAWRSKNGTTEMTFPDGAVIRLEAPKKADCLSFRVMLRPTKLHQVFNAAWEELDFPSTKVDAVRAEMAKVVTDCGASFACSHHFGEVIEAEVFNGLMTKYCDCQIWRHVAQLAATDKTVDQWEDTFAKFLSDLRDVQDACETILLEARNVVPRCTDPFVNLAEQYRLQATAAMYKKVKMWRRAVQKAL